MSKTVARKIALHLDWLCGGDVRLPGGELLSWQGEGAYPYDESLCYLVKLLAWCAELTRNDHYLDDAGPAMNHLRRTVARDGGIGRNGRIYLFDSGVCLSALAAQARVARNPPDQEMQTLLDVMLPMIERRIGVQKGDPAPDDRWSTRFGPHLLKMVIPLCEAGELLGRPELKAIAKELALSLVEECYQDGFFYTDPDRKASYLHGHCYAVEGLIYAVESGLLPDEGLLMKVGDRLFQAQMESGGMQSWWGRDVLREVVDTTAQAVRIWQCIDSKAFDFEIRRGFNFLKSQANKKGGFRYQPDSDHLNTWATVFAVQALLFEKGEPDWRWLI